MERPSGTSAPQGSSSAGQSRPLVMAVAISADGALPLGRLAGVFGGQVETLGGGSTSAVVWQNAWTVEPAVRFAAAIHEQFDATAVGVVAVPRPAGTSMAQVHARARTLVQAVSTMAAPGGTLLSAEGSAIPPSVRTEIHGSLFPDPALEPVPMMRVIAISSAGQRSTARVVGRDAEIAEFRRLVATVADANRGLVLHVQGEPGIGKSHLLDELMRIAAEYGMGRHRVFNVEQEVGRSRSAVAMLVRSLIEQVESDDDATGVETAVAVGRLAPEHVPLVRDLLDLPMGTQERRLFDAMEPALRGQQSAAAVQSLVREASGRAPLFIAVEDVHWASSQCIQVLQAIDTLVSQHPIVLLLTSRDELPAALTLDDPDLSAVLHWTLRPLGKADAQAMASALLSGRRAPWMMSSSHYVGADVVARCVEQSGGHPLVLEQMLINQGADIDPQDPTSLTPMVAPRLAALEAADLQAVRVAAACGTHFDVAVVSRALGLVEPWDVTAAVRAGLVLERGREHRFTHTMVRDAVYAAIEDEPRRAIHRALAEAVTQPERQAEHLSQAGDPGAAGAYLAAAHKENTAGRSGSALAYVERGLEMAQSDDARVELYALRGRILVGRGRPEVALSAFERMHDLARSAIERCRARLGSVSALRLQSRLADAEAPLAEAEALAAEHQRDELIAQAAFLRGCLLFAHGDVDGCLEQHQRAIDHARRADDPRTEALALSGLGDAYYARSRIKRALEVLERCIELSRTHGFGSIEVGNLFMMGAFRILDNDVVAAVRDCIEAAQMAARVGNRRAEMLASLNVGIGLTHRGDVDAALEWIGSAARIAKRMDSPIFLGSCWAFEARALTVAGRRFEGLDRGRAALEASREGNMRFFGGVALGVVARATDSEDERRAALVEGEQLLARGCVSHNYFYFYEDALEVELRGERWDEVERFARAFDTVDAAEPIARCRLLVDRARALAALGRAPDDPQGRMLAQDALQRVMAAGLEPLRFALTQALARDPAHTGGST